MKEIEVITSVDFEKQTYTVKKIRIVLGGTAPDQTGNKRIITTGPQIEVIEERVVQHSPA